MLIAQDNTNKVILKGKLRNFGSLVTLEDFSEMQHLISNNANFKFAPETDSTFSISIPLNKPGYYRIGRNKVYLSPGDNMTVIIDGSSSSNSSFFGKGSSANNYLKDVPFPKGGSYIESGKAIKLIPSEMFEYIKSQATKRDAELSKLNGVSLEFVRLEKARNRADVIKSINSVSSYAFYYFKEKPKEALEKYLLEFNLITNLYKDSLLKNFLDPSFLQIEVYRDIYEMLDKNSKVSAISNQVMIDWKKANSMVNLKIRPLSDKAKISEIKQSVDSIKTKKYREALNQLLAEKAKFGNGDFAKDFVVTNSDKSTTKLSSLKGKVIYIDIWATWCGPCMAEMPNLEELKEKYKGNNELAIVSLSVDDSDDIWLKNLALRKPNGLQWRIDRPKLSEYEVESIPRYILINKDFIVTEMHALKASDKSLIEKINLLLIK